MFRSAAILGVCWLVLACGSPSESPFDRGRTEPFGNGTGVRDVSVTPNGAGGAPDVTQTSHAGTGGQPPHGKNVPPSSNAGAKGEESQAGAPGAGGATSSGGAPGAGGMPSGAGGTSTGGADTGSGGASGEPVCEGYQWHHVPKGECLVIRYGTIATNYPQCIIHEPISNSCSSITALNMPVDRMISETALIQRLTIQTTLTCAEKCTD